MKNKKLFAILTLVCFMLTLMPVAAFAAVDYQESVVYTDSTNAEVDADGADLADICFDFNDRETSTPSIYVWFVKDGANVASTSIGSTKAQTTGTISVISNEGDGVYKITNATEGEKYGFAFDSTGTYTVHAALVNPLDNYKNNKFATKAEAFKNAEDELANNVTNQKAIVVTSSSSSKNYATSVSITDGASNLSGGASYQQSIKDANGNTIVNTGFFNDGAVFAGVSIDANNVAEREIVIKVVDKEGKAVKGETVTLDTNSANIELSKEKATTDQLGQIKFKISGARDGNYKVYVKCGSYESTIEVTVGATGAQDITCVKSPEAPIDVTSDLKKKIEFTFTDANGNAVTAVGASSAGAYAAFHSDSKNASGSITDCRPYVAIMSQPSASKLENDDFYLEPSGSSNPYRAKLTLKSGAKDLAEGTYEIKVVLDNGRYTTVKFEVKEFTTPVELKLTYEADAVEIGSYVAIDTLQWVDANGVTKDCTGKVDLAATGYAVETFLTSETTCDGNLAAACREASYMAGNKKIVGHGYNDNGTMKALKHAAGTVFVKDDDKYIGQNITVIAVDDRYNLTAEATLRVADEATALAFDTKTCAINSNNKVGVAVVDSEGNKVALSRAKSADVSFVILDKPEGAKVSASLDNTDNNILTEGTFKMNLTSNTVGNVTVQAVAKVTQEDNVVRYYTGTQIFAVGKDSVGDVVVMSIGSNEIVINDAKATIDASPIIKNDRTFVPFRALAEAFGATVAYDEATQAVTAELNGVTVVMTIGSATYTVNGAEKTMDVAPFINGSRTMVPVRFAAEAFGIKVIPTYDENGATADILFNL